MAMNASKAGVAGASKARYPSWMRSFALICSVIGGLLLPLAVSAGEAVPPTIGPHPPIWRFNGPPQDPPFSRSPRSQAVWDNGACWSQCGSYCAWKLTQCLYEDATQGNCVINTDSCDLICQRACRSWTSGPFLPID
jgi:hypothetical protein